MKPQHWSKSAPRWRINCPIIESIRLDRGRARPYIPVKFVTIKPPALPVPFFNDHFGPSIPVSRRILMVLWTAFHDRSKPISIWINDDTIISKALGRAIHLAQALLRAIAALIRLYQCLNAHFAPALSRFLARYRSLPISVTVSLSRTPIAYPRPTSSNSMATCTGRAASSWTVLTFEIRS